MTSEIALNLYNSTIYLSSGHSKNAENRDESISKHNIALVKWIAFRLFCVGTQNKTDAVSCYFRILMSYKSAKAFFDAEKKDMTQTILMDAIKVGFYYIKSIQFYK